MARYQHLHGIGWVLSAQIARELAKELQRRHQMAKKKRPTVLKIADDRDVSKDQLLHEPQPKSVPLEPPHYLRSEGLRVWYEYCGPLVDLGLLTEIDRDTFGLYCAGWDMYLEADQILLDHGSPLLISEKGVPYTHPSFNQRCSAAKLISKYAAMLGMSPADRGGMQVQIGGVGQDDLSRRLGG